MAGIKDFEAKKSRCKKEDRNIRMTAQKGNGVRQRTKLLGKSAWSKKKNTGAKEQGTNVKGARRGEEYKGAKPRTPGTSPSTVMSIEQTSDGELVQRHRELFMSKP